MTSLINVIVYLIKESNNKQFKKYTASWLKDTEVSYQFELFRALLCIRDPITKLPTDIHDEIYKILKFQLNSKSSTDITSITPKFELYKDKKISVRKGDITTLTNVTAIVNAANAQMLGCFQPSHRCIDNVIHSVAGPDLRDACNQLMGKQNYVDEPVGRAKITPGFNLYAPYVIHTVGPQLQPGSKPTGYERNELKSCYVSCLKELEKVDTDNQNKTIALCCISTGLFSFPPDIACGIAVDSIKEYFKGHYSSISEVIFNVFTDDDLQLYTDKIDSLKLPQLIPIQPKVITSSLNYQVAKKWLNESQYLIISAGAGLSASVGLDYTSQELFDHYYSNFKKYDLSTIYGTIGHTWPNHLISWSYYFHHYVFLMKFPKTKTYQQLLNLTTNFKGYFIATSNADGFFFKNDFYPHRIFNPQGSYDWIQCSKKCTPDSYTRFGPIVERTLPFINPVTNLLPDESYIPHCDNCGAEMILCLRGGDYFNDKPFQKGKCGYYEFLNKIQEEDAKAVILELGVGLNTPGVLRWPNEELIAQYPNNFKLIRGGNGPSSTMPMKFVESGVGTVLSGEISEIVNNLIK
ncbi:hypothetical protein DFJ63DRAFT_88188 [Scheffersomyces coipomensis]|uniref:uncharacterized protein n=1 Tax=Scheffersomyces coipomensis TaxID=1788519 RepID=UPI00315CC70E